MADLCDQGHLHAAQHYPHPSIERDDSFYRRSTGRAQQRHAAPLGNIGFHTQDTGKGARPGQAPAKGRHLLSSGGHRQFPRLRGRGYNFAYAKDISERRKAEEEKLRLEEQIRRAQKLEALGTLAGGITHDFNNILGVILGYAEIARDDTPHDSATRQDLDKALAAGYRARDLILQILAFSRQSPVERIPLQPQAIVREALTMLRASLPSTIAIREDIRPDCGGIYADPIQIHQIIMNLGINAFHAIETTGGTGSYPAGG